MEVRKVRFKDTNYFSDIILDYLEGDAKLKNFYQYSPNIKAFKEAIARKNFPVKQRDILVKSLLEQYSRSNIKKASFSRVFSNIDLLKQENTFTVTTGHQLCLFTGPLYFIYKIISTINLCKKLKKEYPAHHFVPVYWMATEDHDFDEIDHFRFKDQLLRWKTDESGAVGRMSTNGLEEVYHHFEALIGDYNSRGEVLKKLFRDAYLKHTNHANAFRFLVNELFGSEGLVIIDGDQRELKKIFSPIIKEELLSGKSFELVEETSASLSESYKVQVNPRDINLFYLRDGVRDRIIKENGKYIINNTNLEFSESEIIEQLANEPESFSPNVLLRPVYQECILPNLAYIGGGGELAYWFQLRSSFEYHGIQMPVLFLRNSAKWLIGKTAEFVHELDYGMGDLFRQEDFLIRKDITSHAMEDLELKKEKEEIKAFFDGLSAKVLRVDESLKSFVEANFKKCANKLDKTSEKLIRAEKRMNTERINKIKKIKKELFPNNSLQERVENFSTFYLILGDGLMNHLYKAFELPEDDFILFYES